MTSLEALAVMAVLMAFVASCVRTLIWFSYWRGKGQTGKPYLVELRRAAPSERYSVAKVSWARYPWQQLKWFRPAPLLVMGDLSLGGGVLHSPFHAHSGKKLHSLEESRLDALTMKYFEGLQGDAESTTRKAAAAKQLEELRLASLEEEARKQGIK